ncbi:MAG: malate synthase A [Candidatus Sericytochromatia bacterium]
MLTNYELKLPIGVNILPNINENATKILTKGALDFIIDLHKKFNDNRLEILKKRAERQKDFDNGILPDFLSETEFIRNDKNWCANEIPNDLQDRRVEITGPVERKMMINALNSGANVFMADFEDSNSPTWENCINGQINLIDAINKTISFKNTDGKEYKLKEKTATLIVRPRGWHLTEKNLLINEDEISASIFDFGLYFFHNAKRLLENGTGPYFYLPKMENHKEARLWNDIFNYAQDKLDIKRGTIKVTVLIETILAAFEMEEIIYELKEHIAGLNAGRWDYIFSVIKKFRNRNDFLLPDRAQITMTAPFMRAYTEHLVKICHKRKVHAMGGMSAFIPNRKDLDVTESALKKVTEDKERESNDGFDGTWVAHPDLVLVAKKVFDQHLGEKLNQKDKLREEVNISSKDLLNFNIPDGKVTENGIRHNISIAIRYLGAWLNGTGAVAIFNLMEDAATAEISRSQLWQWLHSGKTKLDNGILFDIEIYKKIFNEEIQKIKSEFGEEFFIKGKYLEASELLNKIIVSNSFEEFLTIPAYKNI